MNDEKPVALVDMDGCLCNYDAALARDMARISSPDEKPFDIRHHDLQPDYIKARMDLIRSTSQWWEDLEEIPSGMEIYKLLLDWGFRIVVLTQGPRLNAEAWKGKLLWCRKHLHEDADVIITRDKGLVYGKVLVDDFPPYIEAWLKHRPRGLVIMPDQPWNKKFHHKQVIRFKGTYKEMEPLTKVLGDMTKEFKKFKSEQF